MADEPRQTTPGIVVYYTLPAGLGLRVRAHLRRELTALEQSCHATSAELLLLDTAIPEETVRAVRLVAQTWGIAFVERLPGGAYYVTTGGVVVAAVSISVRSASLTPWERMAITAPLECWIWEVIEEGRDKYGEGQQTD